MTENTNQQPPVPEYQSLNDILLRKEQLRKDIAIDNAKIKTMWGSLFQKPAALSPTATTSNRLRSMMNMGAGALDGILLAWKLYRKFHKK